MKDNFIKCQNPNCVNLIERVKKGGHWKKFCNSKCRSQYHSNTSSKSETPKVVGIVNTLKATANNFFLVVSLILAFSLWIVHLNNKCKVLNEKITDLEIAIDDFYELAPDLILRTQINNDNIAAIDSMTTIYFIDILDQLDGIDRQIYFNQISHYKRI